MTLPVLLASEEYRKPCFLFDVLIRFMLLLNFTEHHQGPVAKQIFLKGCRAGPGGFRGFRGFKSNLFLSMLLKTAAVFNFMYCLSKRRHSFSYTPESPQRRVRQWHWLIEQVHLLTTGVQRNWTKLKQTFIIKFAAWLDQRWEAFESSHHLVLFGLKRGSEKALLWIFTLAEAASIYRIVFPFIALQKDAAYAQAASFPIQQRASFTWSAGIPGGWVDSLPTVSRDYSQSPNTAFALSS